MQPYLVVPEDYLEEFNSVGAADLLASECSQRIVECVLPGKFSSETQRSCNVEVASRLLVWPLVVPLDELPLHQGQSFSLGALSDRRAGYEGDFIGTRQYRPGDLLRHVPVLATSFPFGLRRFQ